MARSKWCLSWVAALALVATAALTGGGVAQAAPGDPVPAAVPGAKALKAGTPTISGTLAVGSTIKVKTGSWTSKTTFSYQWLRDGASIKGAKKSSYKIASADAGKQLSVKVTGKRKGYETTTVISAVTAKIVKPATPKVSGSAVIGSKLTAKPGSWSSGTQFSYQWLRSGKKIKGATSATYQVAKSDIGKQLSVTVTGKQSGWATVSRTSAKTSKVLKAGAPKITGTASVGKTVKVKAGSWTSKTKLTYQWLRDGKSIKGAKKSSYKIASADAGKQLSVKVTGKRKGYATTARTSAAVTVKHRALKVATPTISGTAKIGSTLTAKPGTWTSGTTFKYQWYADGKAITKATSSKYKVTYLEGSKKLTVEVTGSKSGYATAKRMSKPTTAVPALPKVIYDDDQIRQVGVDVQPGTYRAAGGSQCYWERRTNRTGLDDAATVATGPWHDARVRVTLEAGEYFYSENCGNWSQFAASDGDMAVWFGDGDHILGFDIRPGTYIAQGGPSCVWWRQERAGLELENMEPGQGGVLGVGGIYGGQTIVTILPTDTVFTSTQCGYWAQLVDEPQFGWEMRDGDYAVGIHIRPGTWVSNTFTPQCYVEIASGFEGTYDEVVWWGVPDPSDTELRLQVLPTDVRVTTSNCGTWYPVEDPEPESDGPEPMSVEAPTNTRAVDGPVKTRVADLDGEGPGR